MANDRIALARRQVGTASIADSSFPADSRCDGCLRWVEAAVGDVGPSGRDMGGCAGEGFNTIHDGDDKVPGMAYYASIAMVV